MGNRWATGRIEAFSDGVFSIAITLLVLEIAVPRSEFGNLWHGIGGEWPSYLAYATSFVTIGAEAITETDAERAAVIFYGATLLLISLLVSGLWGVAVRNRGCSDRR